MYICHIKSLFVVRRGLSVVEGLAHHMVSKRKNLSRETE